MINLRNKTKMQRLSRELRQLIADQDGDAITVNGVRIEAILRSFEKSLDNPLMYEVTK